MASADSELSPRNKLYLKISENLSEDEVKSLRAVLITDNHIGPGKIENKTPHEIFNMLEGDRKIGEGKPGLLIEVLKHIGKTQLAQELEKVENKELATTSKRKAPDDASSTKQPKISRDSGGSDESDSSGHSSLRSLPGSMENDEFESVENQAASAEGTADGQKLKTVGDVRKRIEFLRKRFAKLTRYPNNISETKAEELSKVCKETDDLVKLLNEQSKGELKLDIALLDTEIQTWFQDKCESGALHQEIGKEVKQIMRSSSEDAVSGLKPNVKIEFTSENTNFSPRRCATIKVTAEHVELADSCKLDKDSVVRDLFKHLVGNPQKLRPISKYLNSFDVQVISISYGSIYFECLCLTPESAANLQKEYDGKTLEAEIQRVISSLAILTELGIKSISLAVQLKFANEADPRPHPMLKPSGCGEAFQGSSTSIELLQEQKRKAAPKARKQDRKRQQLEKWGMQKAKKWKMKQTSGRRRLFRPVYHEPLEQDLPTQLPNITLEHPFYLSSHPLSVRRERVDIEFEPRPHSMLRPRGCRKTVQADIEFEPRPHSMLRSRGCRKTVQGSCNSLELSHEQRKWELPGQCASPAGSVQPSYHEPLEEDLRSKFANISLEMTGHFDLGLSPPLSGRRERADVTLGATSTYHAEAEGMSVQRSSTSLELSQEQKKSQRVTTKEGGVGGATKDPGTSEGREGGTGEKGKDERGKCTIL